MRWVLRLLLLGLLALPLAAGWLAWAMVQEQPLVAGTRALQPSDIERAKQLLRRHDPRRAPPGALRSLVLAEQELALAASYLASLWRRGEVDVRLLDGAAAVRASFPLPQNPLGRYLNIDLGLVEGADLPRVASLRIGEVRIPSFLAQWALTLALDKAQQREGLAAAADAIQEVRMRAGLVSVRYSWNPQALAGLKLALVPAEDQARWRAYQTLLAEQVAAAPGREAVPMERLLAALMRLAQERSAAGDPQAENRAALIVLAFHVNGKGLGALVPSAAQWPRPAPRLVTLAGRKDFPQHFTISAALAATAGSPLADAVGLYKEVDDARGGSGFSFSDLAADRAGTRFGELAVQSPQAARRLQQRAAGVTAAAELMPEASDLPEFMPEAEFRRRFGGLGQPAYQRQVDEIERRVAVLAVLR